MNLETSTTSAIPDSDHVISRLKAAGRLEGLRTVALQRLEHDERLRQSIEAAVRQSRAFASFSGDQYSRSLASSLQSELGADLLREALQALWRVLSEPEAGVSPHIDEVVRLTMCELHEEELHRRAASGAKQDQLKA